MTTAMPAPVDVNAVLADDDTLQALRAGHPGTDPLTRALAALRDECAGEES